MFTYKAKFQIYERKNEEQFPDLGRKKKRNATRGEEPTR